MSPEQDQSAALQSVRQKFIEAEQRLAEIAEQTTSMNSGVQELQDAKEVLSSLGEEVRSMASSIGAQAKGLTELTGRLEAATKTLMALDPDRLHSRIRLAMIAGIVSATISIILLVFVVLLYLR